jgi:hypothetical protein
MDFGWTFAGGTRERMLGLLVTVRVSDEKRLELIQAMSVFATNNEGAWPARRNLMHDVNDVGHVCWLGRWRTPEAREAFLRSGAYDGLIGAARVLGHLEEVQLLCLQEANSTANERPSRKD